MAVENRSMRIIMPKNGWQWILQRKLKLEEFEGFSKRNDSDLKECISGTDNIHYLFIGSIHTVRIILMSLSGLQGSRLSVSISDQNFHSMIIVIAFYIAGVPKTNKYFKKPFMDLRTERIANHSLIFEKKKKIKRIKYVTVTQLISIIIRKKSTNPEI